MKQFFKSLLALLLLAALLLTGCANAAPAESGNAIATIAQTESIPVSPAQEETSPAIEESESYTSRDDVAAYLHMYGHLPGNFIRKKDAESLGWVSKEGNLGEVAPGMSIGGDRFGNYEGLLPEAPGRSYKECDIDFDGTYRNAKRIVFSNDGLIYYTEDHYETFELLYGEDTP